MQFIFPRPLESRVNFGRFQRRMLPSFTGLSLGSLPFELLINLSALNMPSALGVDGFLQEREALSTCTYQLHVSSAGLVVLLSVQYHGAADGPVHFHALAQSSHKAIFTQLSEEVELFRHQNRWQKGDKLQFPPPTTTVSWQCKYP